MKKVAVVTGASSGIGLGIVYKLLSLDIKVIALSRRAPPLQHPMLEHISLDLLQSKEVIATCKSIIKKESITYLINAAGMGIFKPHEEIESNTITELLHLNLQAPILLSNQLLRSIKQNRGTIINITSIEATRHAKFSALYSASKAGLRAFSLSLFEEVRKSGVNVVSLNADMTDTPFFDNLPFGVSTKEDEKLLVEDIADAVENILHVREGVSINELTIRARRFGIVKK